MPLIKWQYGYRRYVEARVATAKAVLDNYATGLASDLIQFPADQAWNTSEAQTRQDFVATFLGIVDQTKPANVARVGGNSEDNIIRVAVSDTWLFPVESAAFAVGDYIGPSKDTGNVLRNDMFKKVTNLNEAVAKVVKSSNGVNVTTVKAHVVQTKV